MSIPTFRDLFAYYPEIAAVERIKNDHPCARTVRNVLSGVRRVCQACGIAWDEPVTALTRKRLDAYLASETANGVSPVSARTYLAHVRDITARWTLPYYRDNGWTVPPFDLPFCRRPCARYVRPALHTLVRVRDWYGTLRTRADRRPWLAVTLMLEFAMRNGDVGRLKWSDFQTESALRRRSSPPVCGQGAGHPASGRIVLRYVPHKTALTSGRQVVWPVQRDLWRDICRARRDAASGLVVPGWQRVFRALNAELRAEGLFTGAKACYEFRKICIDHVYQNFGAEAASSISGDDIRTVTRFYADPTTVNIGEKRIIDLI